MADEATKKEAEEKVEKTVAPVDFSEAGKLDPAGTKDPDKVDPDPQVDMSKEAKEISETVIDGEKPEEKVSEPDPKPIEESKVEAESPESSQAATDFGVAPTPPAPATVLGETPVAAMPGQSIATAVPAGGPNGPLPDELKHWNWGAFFWSWIWGIANNTWIALLSLLGPLSLVMMIVLGVKGNEWAWQNRKFADLATFKKTQSAWAKWGIIVFILYIVMVVGVMILVISSASTSTTTTTTPNF